MQQRNRFALLLLLLFVLILAALGTAGCAAPDLRNPPRLATQTARAGLTPTPSQPPLSLPAPTATGEALDETGGTGPPNRNATVTLWVNSSQPQYQAALAEMIDAFSASHDIQVELVTIAPDLLPDLINTAAVSETFPLPDLVMMPLEYVVGWAERGILDIDAADAIVQDLGPETFNEDALELVTVSDQVAAIPSDGWQQLILYRSDWFAEQELPPPDSYDALLSAAEVISDRVNLVYSYNMPTESSLRSTTRAFEQMAIANGCQLIDGSGELRILDDACREALAFYRLLCNRYCPSGVQTDVTALNAYLEGRSGIVLASPAVLPAVAGLDDDFRPSCPDCASTGYLAANTAVVTHLRGYDDQVEAQNLEAQNLGTVSYLGITSAANEQAAAAFADYWFNEGYLRWLAVEPERKVPMRLGTAAEPARFIDAWYDLPLAAGNRTLADIFGRDFADQLVTGIVNRDRWAYTQGSGALITKIYEKLTMSILLQELLSGYYDSDRAAIEGYKRLVELIPDYAFYVDPEPTPEE